jgi:hypothetical protein
MRDAVGGQAMIDDTIRSSRYFRLPFHLMDVGRTLQRPLGPELAASS